MILTAAAALAVGLWAWFVSSTFVPLAHAERPVEYVFVGAPVWIGVAAAGACALLLVPLSRRLGRTDVARPLLFLALAPLAAVALVPGAAPRIAVLLYVLVDLRPWWTGAILVAVLLRMGVRVSVPAASTTTMSVILFVALMGWAIVTTPHLRFDAALHGDEPKYLRFCENWYQGNGLEVSHVRTMAELGPGFSPPLWRNAVLFAAALRDGVAAARADTRTLLTQGFGARYNRADYAQAWIVRGKNGGFYQVHNPGLSALLFPAYFVDRHFIAASARHQGVFPDRLPLTNLAVLLIWAGWGVALFGLLRVAIQNHVAAWVCAALAMMTMPMAAFGFQIYPEAAAGCIVCGVLTWVLRGAAGDRRRSAAVAAGLATGFLPWLHVRFLALSFVLIAWACLRARRRAVVAVAYGAALAALCAYAYHITGSIRPDAMYAVEGSESAWLLAEARQSLVSLPLDRIWGFLPHAAVYLLAIPGWWLLAARSRSLTVGLVLLVGALVLPVAGHGFTAAGATPLRQIAAVIPLGVIPLWETLRRWGRWPGVRIAVAILAVLSLDTALSYNLHHYKEVGRHIDGGFSGWAPNLLFPWTHGDLWASHRGTFALFLSWVVLGAALLVSPGIVRPASAVQTIRGAGGMSAALVVFVMLATGATALGGEWTRKDYFLPADRAHDLAVRAAAGQDRCHLCVSSTRGRLGRSNIVAVADQQFALDAPTGTMIANEEVRLPVRAWTNRGIGWGTLAVDFGDGTTTRLHIAGRTELRHRYRHPGTYRVTVRFEPGEGTPRHQTIELTIR